MRKGNSCGLSTLGLRGYYGKVGIRRFRWRAVTQPGEVQSNWGYAARVIKIYWPTILVRLKKVDVIIYKKVYFYQWNKNFRCNNDSLMLQSQKPRRMRLIVSNLHHKWLKFTSSRSLARIIIRSELQKNKNLRNREALSTLRHLKLKYFHQQRNGKRLRLEIFKKKLFWHSWITRCRQNICLFKCLIDALKMSFFCEIVLIQFVVKLWVFSSQGSKLQQSFV